MPSFFVEQALEAYKAGDATVCRSAFMKMSAEEKDEYLTSVRELDSVRSD